MQLPGLRFRCASTWRRCCTASAHGWTGNPDLLFRLRAVDEKDLLIGIDNSLPMTKGGPAAGKVLEADDLSAMFGLDMAVPEPPPAAATRPKRAKPSKPVRKKAKAKKPTRRRATKKAG